MTIQTIDRGTAGDTGDKFKAGVAFDTCQANFDYLESRVVAASTVITITVPTDYATIDLALASIANWIIPNSSTVTILVPTTTLTAAVSVNHPYGSRIKIQGSVAAVSATASAAGAVTGSAGNWSVPLTLSVSTGIAVNDYAIIRNVTGTGEYLLFSGLCKVTAVAGSLVTVKNTAKNAAWPTAALTTADVTIVKNVLKFTAQSYGIKVDGALGSIDNLIIEGTRLSGTIGMLVQLAGEGLKSNGHVYCGTSFGVTSWGDGGVYAQYNGTVDSPYLCVADCIVYNALSQHSGAIQMNSGISSGCNGQGIAATSSGDVSAQNAISVGNGENGLYSIQGGSILCVSAYLWSNVVNGFAAYWGGSIRGQLVNSQYNAGGGIASGGFAVVPTSTFSNNDGSGLYCEGGGNIVSSGSTCSNNGQFGFYADGGTHNTIGSTASSNGIGGFTSVNGGVILCDGASGTGNVSNFASASTGSVIRATNAVTAGATVYAGTLGLVNLTGATGSPVLSYDVEGRFIDAAGVLRSGTNRVVKDSTYSSELTAGLILQNSTTPLKMLVSGYDVTRDYGYIQALHSTVNYKNLALNPNAGNVSIGLGATAPTARLHLAAGTTAASSAPIKLTSGTNMTTPENGAFEFDGTNLYFTVGGVRKTFTLV